MKFLFDNSSIIAYARNSQHISGGAERQQWFLARALASRGHQVVVYSRLNSQKLKLPEDCLIEGVFFKNIRISSKWYFLSTLIAWWKILQKERPDWWYWRCHSYALGFAALFAHFFRTKFIFACAFDADCQPKTAGKSHSFLWILYASGLSLADKILIQHDSQYYLLPKRLRRKSFKVPSIAVDVPVIKTRDNYIAWVGVLREPKRPHLIVELAKKLPDVHFVVCGPVSIHRTHPEYAAKIIEQIKSCENIDYRGHVSPVDAQIIISNATLFLSTSKQEGFPNTFLQAWGAGVPVVSLGVDPGQVIQNWETGIVAKDITQCATVTRRLLKDKKENSRLGQNGITYIKQNHSEEFSISCFFNALGEPYNYSSGKK